MTEDRITQRTITAVMIIIAVLAFVFYFGNVWSLALRLGVPAPIAPLIAPMVDLSVGGLLVALRYLSLRGLPGEQMTAATRLMHFSGLLTLALNVAEPIAAGHYGRAAVDAVAPLLLLGWGTVGPQLLRAFHTVSRSADSASKATVSEAEPVTAVAEAPAATPPADLAPRVAPGPVPTSVAPRTAPIPAPPAPKVPEPLLTEARSIAASHHAEHGEAITPAQLKTRLGIGLPMATALHAAL
ncbi:MULTISPECIES: SpdA protein [Streptomyces]|uniref:SpdA protein n=1 Tax=Streptomyces TaxID=1883 RepID=UPI000CF2657A|nr:MULTISPECIES: SpdA protein [Streptomyces]PPS75546.1 SpdA protein [Streptomyces sp. 46]